MPHRRSKCFPWNIASDRFYQTDDTSQQRAGCGRGHFPTSIRIDLLMRPPTVVTMG